MPQDASRSSLAVVVASVSIAVFWIACGAAPREGEIVLPDVYVAAKTAEIEDRALGDRIAPGSPFNSSTFPHAARSRFVHDQMNLDDILFRVAPAARREPVRGMRFADPGRNPEVDPAEDPLSTFAVDVDTASYSICRRYLAEGQLPPPAAVRTEEFLNALDYAYPDPAPEPFAIELEAGPPSHDGGVLLRVAVQGRRLDVSDRSPATLVFVIDVSGSMGDPDKLDLAKRSLELLLAELDERDRVAVVAYSSEARLVLPPTPCDRRAEIAAAIETLEPDNSTNLEAGLDLGYRIALEADRPGGATRVLLLSDGVANVGAVHFGAVLATVKDAVDDGVTLSCLGFGMGEYDDEMMEGLADAGDGRYAYVDTLSEARRVLVGELTGTLELLARDARIQVEFDPATVARYRLLGYENRALADAEFRDDRRDAGEVGPGHAVTAVYRLALRDGPGGPLATARLRWQEPTSGEWKEIERTIGTSDVARSLDAASPSFRRAACAAEFAERLRSESEIPPRLVQLAREVGPEGLAGLVERASNLPRR